MDTVVQHAGPWTVESVHFDLDDTGPRRWNRVACPNEQERWCTTSEPGALLRDAGLDMAALVLGPHAREDPSRRPDPTREEPDSDCTTQPTQPDEDLPDEDECE